MSNEDPFDQPAYEEERIKTNRYLVTGYSGLSFDEVVANTKQSLSEEGFDVVIEFAFHDYLRQQFDQSINRYLILGACNRELTELLLQGEDKVSDSMLCTITIQEVDGGKLIEVAINDPSVPWEDFDS